jgi:glycerophosphoryl diester phosphodiesterase
VGQVAGRRRSVPGSVPRRGRRTTRRAIGHLDLKEAGYEDAVVTLALEILGPGGFVVTTTQSSSIAHIRHRFPAVVTALSLGHAADQARRLVRTCSCGRDAIRQVRACGADWLAVNYRITGTDVLAACAARDIPCMVWTVNGDAPMARFLADPRVAVLVTDRPLRALRLRADLGPSAGWEDRPGRRTYRTA